MALVAKNDVTQIFAIQAPEVDLPPTFANYPRGWDTARSNNGKPTIKQFNYIQQRTDQNVLWIHQNGGALPYDAAMEYAENAHVVKDGVLQKKAGLVWVSATNKGYNLDYFVGGKSYPLHAEIMLENGDIVKNTTPNNIINPNVDMAGWVFKSQGGLSTVDLSLMWKKSSTVNVRDVLQTAINLTPDGGLLVIPFDIFIDGTVSVVNKNINIECYGKVFVKPNANGSVVFERTDFIEVPAASVLSAAPKKGDLKLSFSSVPVPNLNDYFVAVMSSEVAIKRITPLSDYNKNVTVDFISKDGSLRDPFIYTINDLSTTKLRFVKKSTPVKVSGLHLIPTVTPSVSVDYIKRQYASNIHFDNVIVDLSNHESAGRAIALDWCYGLTHYKTGVIGANKDGVDSYAINNWQSSYCSFVECFYTDTAGNTKEARGYAARHGYHIVLDGCLFSGVDDHWGHDYIIKNMHMKRGVGITGGSVTIIDSTSTADLFYQRDDTPYNDGTLNIVRCRAANRLINSWRNAGDGVTPTKRKLFDFINIDAELIATSTTDSAILILDGNNVDDTFRDTILTINRLDFTVPDVSVRSPLIIRFAADTTFNSANMMNESLNTVKLFKKIHIKNITQSLGNHTELSVLNSPFYGLCADEVIFENVDRCMFANLRATKVRFIGGEIGLQGTANLGSYDSAEISVDRTYFNEFSQEFYHSNVNNPNPKIYISDARFKMYSIAYGKLGFSKIEKSVGCIFDDYNTVQSVRGDYVNLSNYIKANIFTHIPSSAISVPANGVSSTITVAWNNLRGNDLVRGWVSEWNEDLEVETSISGLSNGTLRFKIRNKSSSALSVSANRKIFFKIL